MTGAEIERELRRQKQERDGGSIGMSTALAEHLIAVVVGPHLDEDVGDILQYYGRVIRKILRVDLSDRRLRDLITAAQKTRGQRVFLGSYAYFYQTEEERAEIEARILSKLDADAAAAHAGFTRDRKEDGQKGGRPAATQEQRLRDVIVIDAATAKTPARRLEQANAALAGAGFELISGRTLRRIEKSELGKRFLANNHPLHE